MKTFEQFRTWMKDNHLWDEYLCEFYAYYKKDTKTSPSSLYEIQTINMISGSFVWENTAGGHDFWLSVDSKWREYFTENTMKEFKFVCEEEILARVAMPKDYTICMSAFTKTELKKRIPEITDYRESGNFVYGIRKIWKLKEC